MRLFWTQVYEATTMSDIVRTLELSRASLYAAFGDKEALFLLILKRYADIFFARPLSALSEFADPRMAVGTLLERTAELLIDARLPSGCLLSNTVLECAAGPPAIARTATAGVSGLEDALYQTLHRGRSAGYLEAEVDIRALARFFTGVAQGMALVARATSDASGVRDIAITSLQAWPSPPAA
ncbi:MAG: helix-turn-helix domain-containing protein [Sphingomonas sp.]|jgi:TetR/AcrR family transcriptional repressor of nem operon|uniref:TetR/AcrR family transcriptional regulator n=1 Tax=Sphingomonas sp. TaxID=28214 RepID=UPI00356319DA